MSSNELSDTQKAVKICIGSVSLILNVLTVIFAVTNFWKYLCGKRNPKVLIVLFYFFVFTCTICQCFVSVKYLMMGKPSKYLVIPLKISVTGLFYIVGFSMFTLAVSVQRSLKIIEKKSMVRRQRCIILALVLLMLPNLLLINMDQAFVAVITAILILTINAFGFLYLRC